MAIFLSYFDNFLLLFYKERTRVVFYNVSLRIMDHYVAFGGLARRYTNDQGSPGLHVPTNRALVISRHRYVVVQMFEIDC